MNEKKRLEEISQQIEVLAKERRDISDRIASLRDDLRDAEFDCFAVDNQLYELDLEQGQLKKQLGIIPAPGQLSLGISEERS